MIPEVCMGLLGIWEVKWESEGTREAKDHRPLRWTGIQSAFYLIDNSGTSSLPQKWPVLEQVKLSYPVDGFADMTGKQTQQ